MMKRSKEIGLDFVADKLTNSIENILTGDSFPTDISVSVYYKTDTKKCFKNR